MGHRPIKLLLGTLVSIATTMAASNATALGLGKIKLESSLNQPLDAEIELFEVRDLTASEIRVSIASREDFERIGVDKTFFLSDLRFKVLLDDADNPVVEVRSNKLVREPFLNFVIQVQWPSGKLLREYTLLMDLPIYSGQDGPGVQQPSTASSDSSSNIRVPANPSGNNVRSAFDAAPARPAEREVKPTYTGDTYTVQSNDTLWEIAAQVRPNRSTSVHQTMIALQRNNPEAFINNNINLLKQGQVLRIPDSEEIASLNQSEAVQEVAVQNSEWSGDDSDISDVQLSTSGSFSDSDNESTEREGRVRLSSPDDLFDSTEGRASGSSDSVSTEALENELAITLEQLDKSGRENTELRSKVSSLEEQIATMERMIEVSNEKLRSLELAAAKNEQDLEEAKDALDEQESLAASNDSDYNTDDDLDSGSDDYLASDDSDYSEDDVATDTDATLDDEGLDDGLDAGLDTGAVEEDVVEATPTPTIEPKKVVISRPVPEKGFIDILLDNLLYILGGIVAIAAGAFFFLRKKSEEETDDFLEPQGFVENEQDEEPLVGDAFDGTQDDEQSYDTEEQDPFAGIDVPDALDDSDDIAEDAASTESDEGEPETEDVVGEADIYIAYGKFDQAEEMLLKALKRSPTDEDARLKLLEVYANQGDAESFDPHYAKLRAFAAPTIIERAEALRDSIPNVTEFDESGFDTSDVENFSSADIGGADIGDSEAVESADFDTGLDTGSFDLDMDEAPADQSDEFSMELDLGSEDSGLHDLPEASAEDGLAGFDNAPSGDDLDLDFDLDLPTEANEDSSFDLEMDLPEDSDSSGSSEELSLDDGLDELSPSADAESASIESDFEIDTDLDSDVSLDSLTETLDFSTPEEPAAEPALDADLDISGDLSLDDGDLGSDSLGSDSGLDLDSDLDLGGDLDSELSLAGDSEGELSLDLEADLAGLDSDLDLGDDLDGDVKTDTIETTDFDAGADLEGGSIVDESGLTLTDDLENLDNELDLDADLDIADLDSGLDVGDDLSLDDDLSVPAADAELDLGDLELDGESDGDSDESLLSESLEADLASLDSDTDLSLDNDELSLDADLDIDGDLGDGLDLDAGLELDGGLGDDLSADLEEPVAEAKEEANDFGREDDTVLRAPLTPPSDLDEISEPAPSVSSDTVVNEALNDEYIEQKLSQDLTEDLDFAGGDLDLESELDADLGADLDLGDNLDLGEELELGGDLNLGEELEADVPGDASAEVEAGAEAESEDLDLSSLDDELDALTSNLNTEPLSPVGSEESEIPTVMEEPVTDFDDFEDDLEKDEAMAETVKSDHVSQADVDDMGEDTMFNEAIMEIPEADPAGVEFDLPEVDPEDAGDDDLEFLSDSDEIATKLDLARAYIDMGDQEGARDIIREVEGEGNDQQKAEAKTLLERINS